MWTEHQRPTHQHVRPIYNPAHGTPQKPSLKEARIHVPNDTEEKRSLQKTPRQMAQNVARGHKVAAPC